MQTCLSSLPCSGALSFLQLPAAVLLTGLSSLPGGQLAPPLSCLRCVPTDSELKLLIHATINHRTRERCGPADAASLCTQQAQQSAPAPQRAESPKQLSFVPSPQLCAAPSLPAVCTGDIMGL